MLKRPIIACYQGGIIHLKVDRQTKKDSVVVLHTDSVDDLVAFCRKWKLGPRFTLYHDYSDGSVIEMYRDFYGIQPEIGWEFEPSLSIQLMYGIGAAREKYPLVEDIDALSVFQIAALLHIETGVSDSSVESRVEVIQKVLDFFDSDGILTPYKLLPQE